MKRKEILSILLVAALTTAAAGCGGDSGGGSASGATAVEMRVQRQVGTISLSNDKGENVTLIEKMRLNAGHNLDTAKESYVMVSFDETKVMTLEENASASVVQKGNTLQFDVKKGNAFVNLTEELKGDQAVEVRSGNMVCGMTGTSIQIGKDAEGNDTILVTETDNPDGVSITVTDQNGNVTFHLDAKPGEKVVLQDDTGSVDKSNYDLEDLSVTSLYVIGQYPELVQKTAETFNVPEDHISTLSKLVSIEGENAGPLNGAAAEVMEKALKETKGVTGDALNAEQSILANTRQLLDKVMAKEISDEEKKNLLNTANEQMNNVVKAALDAGVQGENLNNIAKGVAEHIANTASAAIEAGKTVTEITNETKATGANLGTAITQNTNNVAAMEQAISQITNTPVAQQPAGAPGTQQPGATPGTPQPQTPQAENQTPAQQEGATGNTDSGNNGGSTGGTENTGDSGSSGGSTTQPSSSSSTQPSSSGQQPGGTEGQGGQGGTSGSGSGSQDSGTTSSGTHVTAGEGSYQGNNTYKLTINNSESYYTVGSDTPLKFMSYNSNSGNIKLPITISLPGIGDQVVSKVSQIIVGSNACEGIYFEGAADTFAEAMETRNSWDIDWYIIAGSTYEFSKSSDGEYAAMISPGSVDRLQEFYNLVINPTVTDYFYGDYISVLTMGQEKQWRWVADSENEVFETMYLRSYGDITDNYFDISGVRIEMDENDNYKRTLGSTTWRIYADGTVTVTNDD